MKKLALLLLLVITSIASALAEHPIINKCNGIDGLTVDEQNFTQEESQANGGLKYMAAIVAESKHSSKKLTDLVAKFAKSNGYERMAYEKGEEGLMGIWQKSLADNKTEMIIFNLFGDDLATCSIVQGPLTYDELLKALQHH